MSNARTIRRQAVLAARRQRLCESDSTQGADAPTGFELSSSANLMELGHIQVLPLRRRHIARLGAATVRLTVGPHATAVIRRRGPGASHGRPHSSGPAAAVVARSSGRGLRCGGSRTDALPVEALGPAAASVAIKGLPECSSAMADAVAGRRTGSGGSTRVHGAPNRMLTERMTTDIRTMTTPQDPSNGADRYEGQGAMPGWTARGDGRGDGHPLPRRGPLRAELEVIEVHI